MKNFIKYALVGAFIGLMGMVAYAADSGDNDTKTTHSGSDVQKYNIDWKASATATKSDVTISDVNGYVTLGTTTVAGGTDCADNYDITVDDADGVDVFGGELANMLGAGGEQAFPKAGSHYGDRYVYGDLTVAFTELATADCDGELNLYVRDPQ